MLKSLIKVAQKLDGLGLVKEANAIDLLLSKFAELDEFNDEPVDYEDANGPITEETPESLFGEAEERQLNRSYRDQTKGRKGDAGSLEPHLQGEIDRYNHGELGQKDRTEKLVSEFHKKRENQSQYQRAILSSLKWAITNLEYVKYDIRLLDGLYDWPSKRKERLRDDAKRYEDRAKEIIGRGLSGIDLQKLVPQFTAEAIEKHKHYETSGRISGKIRSGLVNEAYETSHMDSDKKAKRLKEILVLAKQHKLTKRDIEHIMLVASNYAD